MSSKPNLKWRPATENDIDKLAGFFDEYKSSGLYYGILVEVNVSEDGSDIRFECEFADGTTDTFPSCQVQYDANKDEAYPQLLAACNLLLDKIANESLSIYEEGEVLALDAIEAAVKKAEGE